MAYIYEQKSTKNAKKQLGLALIIALTLWFLLKTRSGALPADTWAILPGVMAAALFFVLVAFKKNPLALFAALGKGKQKGHGSPSPWDSLGSLDKRFHVFLGITLEFFKIDGLILGPRGIFVVRTKGRPVERESRALEIETRKLWQRCHMIRMLIKKGYGRDIMPQPILTVPGAAEFECNGVAVMPPRNLSAHMTRSPAGLDQSLVKGFSAFLAQRYLR